MQGERTTKRVDLEPKSIEEIQKVYDNDGRFTVADVVLIAKEPIVGAPIISETSYCELFDIYDNRKER